MQKKMLLATVILFSTPTILFAIPMAPPPAAAMAAAKSEVAHQNVAAEKTESTNAATTTTQGADATVASKPNRAKASFYTGLGISMLNDKGFTGPMPKIYVGYGTYIGKSKKFYSALEAFGGAGSISLTPNQHYRVDRLVGASIIPGYMVSDWNMLYLRAGLESIHYSQLNETKGSTLLGFGIETFYTEKWDARFEYDYASNKNLNQFNVDFIYKFK